MNMHRNMHRRFLRALLLLAPLTYGALLDGAGALPSVRAQQPPPTRNRGVVAGPVITLPRGGGDPTVEQATNAEATNKPPRVQRWEYCLVTNFSTEKKSFAANWTTSVDIWYFGGEGGTSERVEVEGYQNRRGVLAKALAELGQEGWEMVGLGPGSSDSFGTLNDGGGALGSPFALYFKRPLQ